MQSWVEGKSRNPVRGIFLGKEEREGRKDWDDAERANQIAVIGSPCVSWRWRLEGLEVRKGLGSICSVKTVWKGAAVPRGTWNLIRVRPVSPCLP